MERTRIEGSYSTYGMKRKENRALLKLPSNHCRYDYQRRFSGHKIAQRDCCTVPFGSLHCAVWIVALCRLDRCTVPFGSLHCAVWIVALRHLQED